MDVKIEETGACRNRIGAVREDDWLVFDETTRGANEGSAHRQNHIHVRAVEILQQRRDVNDLALRMGATHLEIFALNKPLIAQAVENAFHAGFRPGFRREIRQTNLVDAAWL